jgi:hypothetical protein
MCITGKNSRGQKKTAECACSAVSGNPTFCCCFSVGNPRCKKCQNGQLRSLFAESDYAKHAVAITIWTSGEEELFVLASDADILSEICGPDVVSLDHMLSQTELLLAGLGVY